MSSDFFSFPWGVYIGDFDIDGRNTPLCLDTQAGGVCVLFDDTSKLVVNVFIENVALKLIEVLPFGSLEIDVFDFGRNRFKYLSSLNKTDIYHISFSSSKALTRFDILEDLVLSRQHNLLSYETKTLLEYNKSNNAREVYYLLLINLEDFPDEMNSAKRIKNFFSSAAEAGFYTIAFGSKEILQSNSKALHGVLNLYPKLMVENNNFIFNKDLTPFHEDIQQFEYVNENRERILKNILINYEEDKLDDNEQDFLHIPIGHIGKEVLSFDFGLKSGIYSAFISGMTGAGKSNLLNNIIIQIAKNYTAKEIELYLMDYNEGGLEFNKFKNHPNTKKLFLNCNDPQPALELLEEFGVFMSERAEFFNEKGVSSIDSFNRKYPNESISYKILIIDEVQDMFSGEWKEKGKFNDLLKKLAKKGRKYGLHFILATQGLDGIELDKSVIGQIALKISFKLASVMDGMKIFNTQEAYNKVTRLEKYNFIYMKNTEMKVAKADYLDEESIEALLENIRDKRKDGENIVAKIVTTSSNKKDKDELTIKKKVSKYTPKYDTNSAKELLAKYKSTLGEDDV